MRSARVSLLVAIALLLIGGSAHAQPFENPELADVQSAFFWDFPKSAYSAVMATMHGGYGNGLERLYGYRSASTKNGFSGVIAFDLYEPDDVKRSGAGSWQVKQSDFVQMAFWLHSPYTSSLSNASPTRTNVTGLYTYYGSTATFPYAMWFAGIPTSAQLQGCNASITTKDKDQNGFPESASWKAGCNPKALWWLSPADQKLYKKVLKGLKGKGELPAYRTIYY